MSIQANTLIQDALVMIDVVAPGAAADPWFAQLGTRILNGMLAEWSVKGIYNPSRGIFEAASKGEDYFTIGIDDSLRTLSNTTYSVVATEDPTGTYYKSVDGVTAYKTTGTGTTYTLVVTADSAGTYYAINGGYSQKLVGDIPHAIAGIGDVQVQVGSVVYTPHEVTLDEYFAISVKQTTTTAPIVWACDYNTPMAKLYFWPRLAQGASVRLVAAKMIDYVSNNQGIIDIDQRWYTAVLYNLACKMYPILKRDTGIDQELVYMAKTSLTGMRSHFTAVRGAHSVCPFGNGSRSAFDYWTSPLNTVTR